MPSDFLAGAKEVKQPSADFLAGAHPAGTPSPPPTGSEYYAGLFGNAALNALQGLGSGLILQPAAAIQKLITGKVSPPLAAAAQPPPGMAGGAGYDVGQISQFFLPGEGEEALAAKLADLVPDVGKLSPALEMAARAVPPAASMAAINKLQGGNPAIGALAGAGGEVLSEAAQKLAPKLAETALGVGGRERGFGKTPGKAIIEETTGLRPAKVEQSAEQSIDRIMKPLTEMYKAYQGKVSIDPALYIINAAKSQAYASNDEALLDSINKIEKRLTTDLETGKPMKGVDAMRILSIKRGIGDMKWNPNVDPNEILKIKRAVYHALDSELDRAVPEGSEMNQRVSSLLEVKRRAGIESRGAGVTQRALERFGRHTGALAVPITGGYIGEREGGVPGAAIGALLGAYAPELIASPAFQMAVARNLLRAGEATPKIALPLVRQLMANGRTYNVSSSAPAADFFAAGGEYPHPR